MRQFHFLVTKHRSGLSFELRDNPLPTSVLTPELQQCFATALDKIFFMCESFPDGSDEVYILRNLASILPQLLFVYGTRTEQVRRAHDLFIQGRWEVLRKLACPYRRELDIHDHTTPSDVQSRRSPALIKTCHDAAVAPHVGANVDAG